MVSARPLRIAALVKQIPAFEELALGPDGRLVRDGVGAEIDPFCRRAVAQGVTMAAGSGGSCVVVTMGPPGAEDALREALACGANSAVLVSDPALAGSDSLVTARALAAVLRREGPFDLVLTGLHAVDSDTGQVGPEIAELLDLPFVSGVRELELVGEHLRLGCERDDGWVRAQVAMPAVLSVAERLCSPAKAGPDQWLPAGSDLIARVGVAELGEGPWGAAGSPTHVGQTRLLVTERRRRLLSGPLVEQVRQAVALLEAGGALDKEVGQEIFGVPVVSGAPSTVPPPAGPATTPVVAALVEPGRPRLGRELLGAAGRLARGIAGDAVAVVVVGDAAPSTLAASGAGRIVELVLPEASAADGSPGGSPDGPDEAMVASGVADWAEATAPWAILAPSTSWGRHIAGRVAARLGAGLIGDAIEVEVVDGRLLAWKPAFGGQLVAAVTSVSPVQMATLRPGVVAGVVARPPGRSDDVPAVPVFRVVLAERNGPVVLSGRVRDAAADLVPAAPVLVGVGQGVDPAAYGDLDALVSLLGAELVGTRKVTDQGWLPKTRQVGVTGHAVSPRLYVAIGLSGKFNHAVGVRRAGTVLAINTDPAAPIFDAADIGIVGDWREVIAGLTAELAKRVVTPARSTLPSAP